MMDPIGLMNNRKQYRRKDDVPPKKPEITNPVIKFLLRKIRLPALLYSWYPYFSGVLSISIVMTHPSALTRIIFALVTIWYPVVISKRMEYSFRTI